MPFEKVKTVSRVAVEEYCYLVYFAVMFFAKSIGLYEGQKLYNLLLVAGAFFYVCKLLLGKYTVKELLCIAVLLLLGLINYHYSGEKGLLVCMTMITGMKNVSVKRVYKLGTVILGICFFFMVLIGVTGKRASEIYFLHYKLGGFLICHSLGYPHSNVLHITYLVLVCLVAYVVSMEKAKNNNTDKKTDYILFVILMLGNIYVFLYSVSMTGFMAVSAYLVINLYFANRQSFSTIEKVLANLITPLCMSFMIIGPLVIKGELFDKINKALNTRYQLSRYYITEQPTTLFGTVFHPINANYTIDSSWVYLFCQTGLIPFAVVTLLYLFMIYHMVKENKKTELAIILGLSIAGMTEPFMFNLAYKNIGLIFMGEYVFYMLSKKSAKLSSVMDKEIRFCSFGEKKLPGFVPFYEKIYEAFCKTASFWRKRFVLALLVSAIGAVACGITCKVCVLKPETVYVNEDKNEKDEWPKTYMTRERVNEEKAKGNLVLDYISESSPMFGYGGKTANLEYARWIISSAVFGAFFALIIVRFALGILVKQRQ